MPINKSHPILGHSKRNQKQSRAKLAQLN